MSFPEKPVEFGKPKAEATHLESYGSNEDTKQNSSSEGQVIQCIRDNPKILLLCFFANLGALMYGFDNLALSICLSMPSFQAQFGTPAGPHMYIIPAYWQSLWNALAQVATMIGAWTAGPIADRFGRRISFCIGAIISIAGIAVVYTASSPSVFLAGKMVNGVALGICITTGQTYVSEISPLTIRGITLSGFTFFLNLGYMVAASIAFKRVAIMNTSAYKVLFASGWAWPAALLVFIWLVPETPYHLVRTGDVDKARISLQRLHKKGTDVSGTLEAIVLTNQEEKEHAAAAQDVSFLECFRGTNWRRTRIILYANGLSQMIGASFIANGPYFLVSAGMSPMNVAMMIEIGIAFGIVSSIITFFCIRAFPRRNIILTGVGMALVLFVMMGIAGCFPHRPAALWTVGIALQLLWWTLGPAIGPATAIAGEISVTRLRAKSQALGFGFNYFYSTIWNVVVPYMFNPTEGNLGGLIGWIYAFTAAVSLIVIYFEFPETKGRAFIELDHLFELRLSARKFKGYKVPQAT